MDWMTVTADFAVGSSGGPVFNRHGAVVGMVARTHTINADPKSESPTTQMVVKMTIPSEDILSLIESGKGRATTTKERR
jgi:S1-C subfamily serine protease